MAGTINAMVFRGFAPPAVLSTTEARTELPELAARAREEGLEAEVVFCGPHGNPDLALVPAALFEALAPYFEDLVIAERIRARRAADDGRRLTLDEVVAGSRSTSAEITDAAEELAAELGV